MLLGSVGKCILGWALIFSKPTTSPIFTCRKNFLPDCFLFLLPYPCRPYSCRPYVTVISSPCVLVLVVRKGRGETFLRNFYKHPPHKPIRFIQRVIGWAHIRLNPNEGEKSEFNKIPNDSLGTQKILKKSYKMWDGDIVVPSFSIPCTPCNRYAKYIPPNRENTRNLDSTTPRASQYD